MRLLIRGMVALVILLAAYWLGLGAPWRSATGVGRLILQIVRASTRGCGIYCAGIFWY